MANPVVYKSYTTLFRKVSWRPGASGLPLRAGNIVRRGLPGVRVPNCRRKIQLLALSTFTRKSIGPPTKSTAARTREIYSDIASLYYSSANPRYALAFS